MTWVCAIGPNLKAKPNPNPNHNPNSLDQHFFDGLFFVDQALGYNLSD